MSRLLKNRLLDMLGTMKNANDVFSIHYDLIHYEELYDLSVQLQNVAIEIGQTIEQRWPKCNQPVILLEKYCEDLFQILDHLSNRVNLSSKPQSILNDDIKQIVRSIEQNISNQLEVVFFPYKKAMWDSLESVYNAAKQDKDTDVYLVPIPYYNKKPDGSYGQIHYEGELYQSEYEVTDYKEYQFETRYPDVIFFHNPYDNDNYITSVDPRFYAKNLRGYTSKLVYIPYFIHQNNKVKEDYCLLPGTLYATDVILQSEEVRRQYIYYYRKILTEAGKSQYAKGAESKFQALGSPKFDVVYSKNVHGQQSLPDEWNRLIYKKSIKKKVIFYNTHLSDVMNTKADLFIRKLRMVLDTFHKSNDVVLLWRPHPLTEATLDAVNSEIKAEYEQIVKMYKEQKWGIYDDSSDLDRAIAVSDGYYGDKSSVVELFQYAGKPVMIQDIYILEE